MRPAKSESKMLGMMSWGFRGFKPSGLGGVGEYPPGKGGEEELGWGLSCEMYPPGESEGCG